MADPTQFAKQPDSILRFEDVSLRFGSDVALDRVTFCVRASDTRVLLGQAGSGKTVLMKVALGLVKPDSGRVFLFDQDITDWPESKLFDIRSHVGMLFQEGGLFDSQTIEENVAYPLLNQRVRGELPKPAREQVHEKVVSALTFVELEKTLDKFPSELSGGMRRRVGIARAIVTEPPLVLYDSPTAGLDPITANTIMALIIKERDMRNTASMIVTHRYQDGNLMANFRYNPSSGQLEHAWRVNGASAPNPHAGLRTTFMVMRDGRVVFEGSEKELMASTDEYVGKFVKR
ncbi:MAG: ATP-binding cassette domain-containing protein [Bryobacteraceae bacterium]